MSTTFTINRRGILTGYSDPGPEIIIPEGVTAIGDRAFKNETSLQKIVFPASLERICTAAFRGCAELKEIVFSTGLRELDGSVFRASGLETVRLPEGLSKIGPNVFAECTGLEEITLPASLTAVGSDCFLGCEGLKRLTVLGKPSLKPGMFAGCYALDFVDTPCLSPAKLPKGSVKNAAVVSFVQRALNGESLPHAAVYSDYIRKQRKSLYSLAVQSDALLQFLIVNTMLSPQDVHALLDLAGTNVPVKAALLDYQHKNGGPIDPAAELEKEFAKSERIAVYMEKHGTLPVSELKKIWSWKKREDGTLCITSYKGSDSVVTVPDHIGQTPVTAVEKTFYDGNRSHTAIITSVTLPEGLTEIGPYTFSGCDSLQEITIPKSVRKIGGNAFSRSGLRHIVVLESVQEIGAYAFAICRGLKTIVLPKSLCMIGRDICYKSPAAVICAPAGSYAENYAKNNQIAYKLLKNTGDS